MEDFIVNTSFLTDKFSSNDFFISIWGSNYKFLILGSGKIALNPRITVLSLYIDVYILIFCLDLLLIV